jgi:hypothetical protein
MSPAGHSRSSCSQSCCSLVVVPTGVPGCPASTGDNYEQSASLQQVRPTGRRCSVRAGARQSSALEEVIVRVVRQAGPAAKSRLEVLRRHETRLRGLSSSPWRLTTDRLGVGQQPAQAGFVVPQHLGRFSRYLLAAQNYDAHPSRASYLLVVRPVGQDRSLSWSARRPAVRAILRRLWRALMVALSRRISRAHTRRRHCRPAECRQGVQQAHRRAEAIIEDEPGTTRDRICAQAGWAAAPSPDRHRRRWSPPPRTRPTRSSSRSATGPGRHRRPN